MNNKNSEFNEFYQSAYINIIFDFYTTVFKMCVARQIPVMHTIAVFDVLESMFQEHPIYYIDECGNLMKYIGIEEINGTGLILGPEYLMNAVSKFIHDRSTISQYTICGEDTILPADAKTDFDNSVTSYQMLIKSLPFRYRVDTTHAAFITMMIHRLANTYGHIYHSTIYNDMQCCNKLDLKEYLCPVALMISVMLKGMTTKWYFDVDKRVHLQLQPMTRITRFEDSLMGNGIADHELEYMFDTQILYAVIIPSAK